MLKIYKTGNEDANSFRMYGIFIKNGFLIGAVIHSYHYY